MSYGFHAPQWRGKSEGVTRLQNDRDAPFCFPHTTRQIEEAAMLNREKDLLSCENGAVSYQNGILNRKPPLRLWQVAHFFKCPLIGMCLTYPEQRQLLKKSGLANKRKSPFEIHQILVAGCDNEDPLSRRMDGFLNRKFSRSAVVFFGMDDHTFMPHFKAAIESGESAKALWIAAVSPELSMSCRRKIFADIHMAMHTTGQERLRLKSRLSRQQEELNNLRQEFKAVTRQRRQLQKNAENHQRERMALRAATDALKKEKSQLQRALAEITNPTRETELKKENRKMRMDYDALCKRLEDSQHQVTVFKAKNARLSAQIAQQIKINSHFRAEIQTVTDEMTLLNRCDASCPAFDLCKKRILIVGGLARMESLYRELIEGSGGVFEYHDGHVKKGVKTLECRLKRADVVLCPVSCNSHTACSLVKNLGKKYKKPVYMLPNSSLSTVSKVIWEQ
jgi:hypothetical protein